MILNLLYIVKEVLLLLLIIFRLYFLKKKKKVPSIAFSIFEEYSQNITDRRFTLVTEKDCVWIKIYVSTKDQIDLVEKLNILNSLFVKHGAEGYDVFKDCICYYLKKLFFLCEKKKKKSTELIFFG